jgi:hypothetical protein
LRFIQRIASTDKAFEVGYYKSTSTNTTTGEKRSGYGKFHVLLRKENGVWKILMDADANEKRTKPYFFRQRPWNRTTPTTRSVIIAGIHDCNEFLYK